MITAKTDGQAASILLIDDNAIQAATRQAILRRAGYFVIAALNPQRVLEQFQNDDFPVPIQLVLTDHMMPEMNGAQFVRELRKIHPDLPVIVISGLEEAVDEYHDLNVEFHLKPLMPEQLLATVQRLVAVHQ
jgi:DNA-binding NtrC family response regulator